MKRLLLLLLLQLLLLPSVFAQPASAPTRLHPGDVPDARKRDRVIALLPVRSYDVGVSELFAPEAPRRTDWQSQVESGLLAVLQTAPLTRVVSPEQVRQILLHDVTLQTHRQTAAQRYRRGLEQYLNLEKESAAQTLQTAVEMARAGFQDVVDPKPLADAQVMLGVSLLDREEPAKAHIALRDAFAVQPDRRFRVNFFAPGVNQELTRAFVDWQETSVSVLPYGDNRRMAALTDKLGADALLVTTVRMTPQGPELWLTLFDARRRAVDSELRVSFQGSVDKVDAFLSRWLSCAPIAESAPDPSTIRRDDGVRVDTSGGYALYLRHPTRQIFHSIGFSAAIAHEFRSGIEWFGRVSMYTSIADSYGDLLHTFNSLRLVGGLGFTLRSGPWRFFLRPGMDVHLFGDFVATTDPQCKLFGLSHPRCDPGTVSDLQQRILVGTNLSLGGAVHIGRNFYVSVQGSGSIYFLPLGGTEKLNYPVGGDIGLGYAF